MKKQRKPSLRWWTVELLILKRHGDFLARTDKQAAECVRKLYEERGLEVLRVSVSPRRSK
jgi:hypothetical protein